jgi:hypothetical protein
VPANPRLAAKPITDRLDGSAPQRRGWPGDLGKTIVIRLDASIVVAHSEKMWAQGIFKGT